MSKVDRVRFGVWEVQSFRVCAGLRAVTVACHVSSWDFLFMVVFQVSFETKLYGRYTLRDDRVSCDGFSGFHPALPYLSDERGFVRGLRVPGLIKPLRPFHIPAALLERRPSNAQNLKPESKLQVPR